MSPQIAESCLAILRDGEPLFGHPPLQTASQRKRGTAWAGGPAGIAETTLCRRADQLANDAVATSPEDEVTTPPDGETPMADAVP